MTFKLLNIYQLSICNLKASGQKVQKTNTDPNFNRNQKLAKKDKNFRNVQSDMIWVRSRNCDCLVTWFCYQLIAKPGNKTATVSWPDPYHFVCVCVCVCVWGGGGGGGGSDIKTGVTSFVRQTNPVTKAIINKNKTTIPMGWYPLLS